MTLQHQLASDTENPALGFVPSIRALYAAAKAGREKEEEEGGAMAAVLLPGNLQDEATCSVCLEYFKDPVSIQCGHNFCRACISKSWKSLEVDFPCPQCREVFKEKSFRPNRQLANMSEIISQFILHGGRGLEDDRICEKHKEALKLYCKDDQKTICVVCDRSRDHRPHAVVPVEEAAQEYKEQIQTRLDFLKKERQELLEFKTQDDKKSQELLKTIETERQKVLSEFEGLRQFLHDQEQVLLGQLDKMEKGIVKRQNENITELSKEMSLLNKFIADLEDKSQESLLDFLKDVTAIIARSDNVKCPKPIPVSSDMKGHVSTFSLKTEALKGAVKKFKDHLRDELGKANSNLGGLDDSPDPITNPTAIIPPGFEETTTNNPQNRDPMEELGGAENTSDPMEELGSRKGISNKHVFPATTEHVSPAKTELRMSSRNRERPNYLRDYYEYYYNC
ncbi:E3 ubiquitin-protein ligase TRIM7-like isoform X6 [Ahaetulla prasina]|uniref:E3 ubiquitin-protein ligase TRIM7-like isoform X6 n=1 Tax=Ahaetulla prasina TaxID=499056 RepID=UPI002649FC00|nr:E3 ubiquitin-protein ligase TRIM7-like isoform X6 [Ahaetulla prasina]